MVLVLVVLVLVTTLVVLSIVPGLEHLGVRARFSGRNEMEMLARWSVGMEPQRRAPEDRPRDERRQQDEEEQDAPRHATLPESGGPP
jgi:hypothetical protein